MTHTDVVEALATARLRLGTADAPHSAYTRGVVSGLLLLDAFLGDTVYLDGGRTGPAFDQGLEDGLIAMAHVLDSGIRNAALLPTYPDRIDEMTDDQLLEEMERLQAALETAVDGADANEMRLVQALYDAVEREAASRGLTQQLRTGE